MPGHLVGYHNANFQGFPTDQNNHNSGPNGVTFQDYGWGHDIDIPPNCTFATGFIITYGNRIHDLRFGDKLWYSYEGVTSGGQPRTKVFSNFAANRNYGPTNSLRRSNTAAIGYMEAELYTLLHRGRRSWDRTGPRVGQHFRRRYNMKVIRRHHFVGYKDERDAIPVVVWWNN